jgi:spermine oxidase
LGFYVVASHPTALNSWITGPTARLMERLDESYVKTTFIKVLRKFLGSLYEDIPEPENFLRSAWSANPFTRGSYSFRSVESEHHDVWATDISTPIIKNEIPVRRISLKQLSYIIRTIIVNQFFSGTLFCW